jgi:sulfur carrier protein ThiS
MKKIIFAITVLLFISLIGCTTTIFKTTHYKKKDQLPKDVKYFNIEEQVEVSIVGIERAGRTYLYCYEGGTVYDGASDRIPESISKVKIIGIYEWIGDNQAPVLTRSLSAPKTCTAIYYVCEVENYGYVFFTKASLDNKIAYTERRQKEIKEEQKYDAFLDKLKPADRELITAINGGFYDFMESAIKNGANVNVKDIGGNTPLILASIKGADDMVEYLLRRKANVNAANNEKLTALIAASANSHVETVRLLLAYKANVNLRTSFGMSAYDLASLNKNTAIMYLLRAAGAK